MIIQKRGNLFVVKIFKEYLNGIDIYDRDSIINLFKKIMTKLKKKYDLCGLVDIKVYINDDYGMIMEVKNVYKYRGEIDIKINFNINSLFLYEINDCNDGNGNIYYYDGKYYCDCLKISMDSNVIYKNNFDIINKGIKVR